MLLQIGCIILNDLKHGAMDHSNNFIRNSNFVEFIPSRSSVPGMEPTQKTCPMCPTYPQQVESIPMGALWSDFIFSVSRNLQPMCWKHFRTQFRLIHVEPTAIKCEGLPIKCFASRLGFVPLVSRTIGKDTMSLISSLDRIPSSPSAATPPNTLDIRDFDVLCKLIVHKMIGWIVEALCSKWNVFF